MCNIINSFASHKYVKDLFIIYVDCSEMILASECTLNCTSNIELEFNNWFQYRGWFLWPTLYILGLQFNLFLWLDEVLTAVWLQLLLYLF